ncbi:3-carboxy-cis,cis-muconate cycloisomerase [Streptomyces sp. NRRL F-5126]|uniref:3-carboxy-cis,cis-muconate cycloisomerase n=1 Tax=Streptomyces sp. NRRL F-5126 TaxID=1463857 RepID=UPI00068BB3C1|nr:3-carboxy-cis,cis-muconate cycloisomerase [Streptomyces sp. NRRL F-5126]
MSSTERDAGGQQGREPAGLLSPATAGTRAEAATDDRALLRALVAAEAALARAQGAPGEAADAIASAVDALDVRELALAARAGGNPVIPLASALRAAVGDRWARYVHRGATSQDIVDTALMLVATHTRRLVLADLERASAALARLAAAHRDTVMPGRTLTQHAVPTTFGLKAAGWRSLVLDARDRLDAVVLPAQLGGAAGTLAALGDSPLATAAAYARELGLADPGLPWHTLRTPVADLAAALAFTCGALGKTAVDVLTLCRTEVGEVAEGSGGGSSAMPHKANPVHATLIAAAARQAPAHLSVLFGAVPAEDERPAGAWHAEWAPLRELLRLAGGAAAHAAELAEGLRVFPGRMAENLARTGGLIVSERFSVELGRAEARRLLDRAAAADVTFAEAADAAGHGRLLDPAAWTGAAGALVDRALHRD